MWHNWHLLYMLCWSLCDVKVPVGETFVMITILHVKEIALLMVQWLLWVDYLWPIWIWILQSKIRFFIPFHCNLILDCNPNDPPQRQIIQIGILNWFWIVCSIWSIDCILDCLITWTADQKSQGNLDPGTSVWKQIRYRILCSSWSSIWSNFRLKNPHADWAKGIIPPL